MNEWYNERVASDGECECVCDTMRVRLWSVVPGCLLWIANFTPCRILFLPFNPCQ